MADYTSLIEEAARKYGLNPALFSRQIKQESNYNPNAVSSAGAAGLAQIMETTGRDPGYGIAPISSSDRFDPAKSLDFGASYMAAMMKEFGGDERKALAAYNAGAGTVQKRGMNNLPAETRDYVRRITGEGMPYSNSPIQTRDIMSGATRTVPGRPVTRLQFSDMEEATANPTSAKRRDKVELANSQPTEDMSFFDGFLNVPGGGLLDRIGGGIAATKGRHPAQRADRAENLATHQEQRLTDAMSLGDLKTPTDRFQYAIKLSGDPEVSMQFAQTGDLSVLQNIDPNKAAASTGQGLNYQALSVGPMADGSPGVIRFDRDTGLPEMVPVEGGEAGFSRYQDSGLGKTNDLNAADNNEFEKKAGESIAKSDRLIDAYEAADNGTLGPTALKALQRTVVKNFGVDIGEMTPDELSEMDNIVARFSLDGAKDVAGQGALSNYEREGIKAAAPNIEMTPGAWKKVVGNLIKGERRTQEIYEAWREAPPEVRKRGFNDFHYAYMKKTNADQRSKMEDIEAERARLKPGDTYTDIDGNIRRKQ